MVTVSMGVSKPSVEIDPSFMRASEKVPHRATQRRSEPSSKAKHSAGLRPTATRGALGGLIVASADTVLARALVFS